MNEDANTELPNLCLAGLIVGVAAIGAEALVMSPMLEDIGKSLNASAETMGITVAVYGFALALAAPAFGLFGSHSNRVRTMIIGLILFVAGTLGCALAVGPVSLMAGRIVCGVAAGAFLPTCYAFVGGVVPYAGRARVMGKVMFGWSLSLVVGVPVGGAIGQFLGWRIAFVSLAVISLLSLGLLFPFRRFGSPVDGGKPAEQSRHWRIPRKVWPIFGVTFLNMAGFYLVYTYLGTAIRNAQGVKSAGAAAYVLCYGVGLAVSTLRGHLLDRFGKVRASAIALLLLFPLLAALPWSVENPVALCLSLILWGVFQGTVITGLNTVLTEHAGEAKGLATSLNSSLTYLAVALSATVGGIMMAHSPGFTAVGIAGGIACLLAWITLKVSRTTA